MYKVNDIVVYRRDVCKIVGKHRSDFTGEMCYDLVPYMKQDGSVKMQVPVSNKAGNLRDLITEEEIRELIISAPDIQTLENKPANMKSQYAALLKGNAHLPAEMKALTMLLQGDSAGAFRTDPHAAQSDSNEPFAVMMRDWKARLEM